MDLALRFLFSSDVLVFEGEAFFLVGVLVKYLFPTRPFVNYCMEYLTVEEQPRFTRVLKRYERYADRPDLVLDVESHRAAARQYRYRLTKQPLVIPNTLPHSEVPPPAPRGSLAALAGAVFPTGVPVLVYAGGIHAGTGMEAVISALSCLSNPVCFLAFCNAEDQAVAHFRSRVEAVLGRRMTRILSSVPRFQLLSCIAEADAGLVYYPVSVEKSFNQRYCAPAKFFEYVSVGLPVVASSNPSLVDLIDHYGVGDYASDDTPEALTAVLESFMFDSARLRQCRQNAVRVFRSDLCYELKAQEALARIEEMTLLRG
ncbi:MAG: hypothetical protein JW832_13005 [Deltaproteobacteria bacterium]|nr:hypothetical protein [Deltaproteobacteria bacterium]